MLGNEQKEARIKRAQDHFASIQKGLGLRRPDLPHHLGPDLCRIWRIADIDEVQVVRAKAIIRLEDLLDELSDPALSRVVRTSYNFSLDPETSHLKLSARQGALAAQERERYSSRTIQRLTQQFQRQMLLRLRTPFDDLSSVRIDSTLRREQQFALPNARSRSQQIPMVCRSVQRLYSRVDPAQEAIREFLGAEVHVPTSRAVNTSTSGNWLCVFSDSERLDRYRRATSAPWTALPEVTTGADIARRVSVRMPGVGILLNPSPHRGGNPYDTLMLPPETVRQVA